MISPQMVVQVRRHIDLIYSAGCGMFDSHLADDVLRPAAVLLEQIPL